MKKMSIAFVAAMSLVSFAGCKKKGNDAMGKVVEMKDKMCKCTDKACADKVQDEYNKWAADMAKNADKDSAGKGDAEEGKKMADAMKEYGECMAKASGGGGAGSGAADDHKMDDTKKDDTKKDDTKKDDKAAGGGGDLPAECNDYKAAIDKLAACDKLPQATRDQMKQAFDTASAAWKDMGSMPAEAKKALSDGCKTAADAVTKAAEACK